MISIEDLINPPTQDQVFESWLSELETLGIPARSWFKGGVSRTILRVVALTYAIFAALVVLAIKSAFLDTATGDWLTRLAYYVYGVTRTPARFASGVLQFANTGGAVYSFAIGEIRAVNPDTGKAYANAEAFTLNPGDIKNVSISAVEVGSASSCAPNTITQLETVLLFVTITNPEAVVGVDAQDDETLRQLCRDKLAALSLMGPRGAYAYAVGIAVRLDGSPVDINRRRIYSDPNTGIVTVICASPAGTPISSDLDAVALSIENVARPDGVTAVVVGASESPLAQTITVWAQKTTGLDATTLEGLVNEALILAIETYPIGGLNKPPALQGKLWASFVDGVAKSAHPAVYATDGALDLSLNTADVATLAATVAVRFTELSQ